MRTALKEWAYAQTYTHSWKRTACLPRWTVLQLSPSSLGVRQKTSGFRPSILDREGTTC
ncbi:MAG: hypothetical protein DBY37_07045 [Desulfovibrionaceae bacterium]|nr:MAG: hypothetical protein DBY37_07045 [Desulfovibrionaceae bacterium]